MIPHEFEPEEDSIPPDVDPMDTPVPSGADGDRDGQEPDDNPANDDINWQDKAVNFDDPYHRELMRIIDDNRFSTRRNYGKRWPGGE